MKRVIPFHSSLHPYASFRALGLLMLLLASFIPRNLQASYCSVVMPQVNSNNGCAQAQAAPYSDEGHTVYYLWARNSNGFITAETSWSTSTDLSFCPEQPGFYRLCAMVSGCRRMVEGGDVYVDEATFPVEWLSFQVRQLGNMAKLAWSTASELNAAHFEVQRSADGAHYESLGKVNAAGNSQTVQVYSFQDALHPGMAGKQYTYRLKQVDVDGQFDFSPSVELSVQQAGGITLYAFPNPFRDLLTLKWESGTEILGFGLFNPNGQLVLEEEFSRGSYITERQLSLADLPTGVYILKLKSVTGQLSQKIVKR